MSSTEDEICKCPKTRKRKTKGERNKIRVRQLKKGTVLKNDKKKKEFNEHVKILKDRPANQQPKVKNANEAIQKTMAILGKHRLTRKLGIFNQSKQSDTIIQHTVLISESTEKKTNEEISKMLCTNSNNKSATLMANNIQHFSKDKRRKNGNAKRPSNCKQYCPVSIEYDSSFKDKNCNKKSQIDLSDSEINDERSTMYKRKLHISTPLSARKSASSIEYTHTPMETENNPQEKFSSSQDILDSPPLASIASKLTSSLSLSRCFQGRNLYQETSDELYSMIQMNSSFLGTSNLMQNSVSNMKISSTKTPSASQGKPSFRGSCSSETVRRSTSNDRATTSDHEMEEKHADVLLDTLKHNNSRNYYNLQNNRHKHNSSGTFPTDIKLHKKHEETSNFVINMLEDSPCAEETSFITVSALTDAKALLDCNEKVSEFRQSSQEYHTRRHSDVATNLSHNVQCKRKDDRMACTSVSLSHKQYCKSGGTNLSGRNLYPNLRTKDTTAFGDINFSRSYQEFDMTAGGDRHLEKPLCRGSEYKGSKNMDIEFGRYAVKDYFTEDHLRNQRLQYTGCYHKDTSSRYGLRERKSEFDERENLHHPYGGGDRQWECSRTGLTEINIPRMDLSMDLLDYLDEEHGSAKHHSKSRHSVTSPYFEGSPSKSSWYMSFKPEPLVDSPEKMYPRKL